MNYSKQSFVLENNTPSQIEHDGSQYPVKFQPLVKDLNVAIKATANDEGVVDVLHVAMRKEDEAKIDSLLANAGTAKVVTRTDLPNGKFRIKTEICPRLALTPRVKSEELEGGWIVKFYGSANQLGDSVLS